MRSKTLTHQLEFSDAWFHIAVADTLEKAATAANKCCGFHVVAPDEPKGALMYEQDNEFVVLFQFEQLDLPTIVHELGHVTTAVFKRMGVRLSKKSEEAYRYHDAMLMRICMEWLVENKIEYLPYEGYVAPPSRPKRQRQVRINPNIMAETLARAEAAVATVMSRRTD